MKEKWRTVKEVSKLTGVSARTLHWYDEIGLLKPSGYSEAGYRLYNDKALETLQQILFFREFNIPLGEIKQIMEGPGFDSKAVLTKQKRLLELEKIRLERLISSLDSILKGENGMDFAVFDRTEVEAMVRELIAGLNPEQANRLASRYGSLEAYREMCVENLGRPRAQANLQKITEWFGGKENALQRIIGNAGGTDGELITARANRLLDIQRRLAEKKGADVRSYEVKQIVGEWDYAIKMFSQIEDLKPLMLDMAEDYLHNPQTISFMRKQYGEGMADFFAEALQAFYQERK